MDKREKAELSQKTLTEGNDPEERVMTKNGDEIGTEAQVVRHSVMESVVLFVALLTELDSGELARDQVQVERHEGSDDEGEDAGQDVGRHHEVAHLVVEGLWVAHSASDHGVARRHDQDCCHRTVEKHVHEELVVVESDAVGDPRAMVVHLENAPVALGTVVAPVRFRLVAPLTDANATVTFALNRGLDSHDRRIFLCCGA